MTRYIASTDVNAETSPHVTVQWEDDHMDEIVVNNLLGKELSHEDFLTAWQTAHDLKAVREEC